MEFTFTLSDEQFNALADAVAKRLSPPLPKVLAEPFRPRTYRVGDVASWQGRNYRYEGSPHSGLAGCTPGPYSDLEKGPRDHFPTSCIWVEVA